MSKLSRLEKQRRLVEMKKQGIERNVYEFSQPQLKKVQQYFKGEINVLNKSDFSRMETSSVRKWTDWIDLGVVRMKISGYFDFSENKWETIEEITNFEVVRKSFFNRLTKTELNEFDEGIMEELKNLLSTTGVIENEMELFRTIKREIRKRIQG